jgi:hypothetical protein
MCLFLAVTRFRRAIERSCTASVSPLFADTRDTRLAARGSFTSPKAAFGKDRLPISSRPTALLFEPFLDAVLSVTVSTLGPFDWTSSHKIAADMSATSGRYT